MNHHWEGVDALHEPKRNDLRRGASTSATGPSQAALWSRSRHDPPRSKSSSVGNAIFIALMVVGLFAIGRYGAYPPMPECPTAGHQGTYECVEAQ